MTRIIYSGKIYEVLYIYTYTYRVIFSKVFLKKFGMKVIKFPSKDIVVMREIAILLYY